MINRILKNLKTTGLSSLGSDNQSLRSQLIKLEAMIGGDIFGPVPDNRYREFYCHDEKTWVWYEQWSEHGKDREAITTYDVRSDGVYKSHNGTDFSKVSENETIRLYEAAKRYRSKVKREVYQYA